jgi:RNA methyltransferase, TrmH family
LARENGKSHSPYPTTILKLLTLARDLRRRKSRDRQRLFVSEGVRAVEELLRSSLNVRGALIAPQLRDAPRGAALIETLRSRGVATEEVGAHEFASAAETESPQGVIAIAESPELTFADVPDTWTGVLVVLDGIQDPGNVGTILRTAAALGAVATVTLPGTVDLWNAKVVRSGMGAHFKHPAFSTTWSELDTFRERAGVTLLAADANGEAVAAVKAPPRSALVVGNEGAGLSSDARTRADRVVALPLAQGVESLNVAVATGILLYLLNKQ